MLKGEVFLNPRVRDLASLMKLDAADMQRITAKVDVTFREQSRAVFSTEGAAGGEKWEALSPAYAKQKRRTHPGRKILTREGRLRRSLTEKGAEHVAYGYTQPTATVVVGTENPVAAYHAPGLLHNPNLPVRDPIQRTQQQMLALGERIKEYLVTVKLPRLARVLQAAMQVPGSGRAVGGGRA